MEAVSPTNLRRRFISIFDRFWVSTSVITGVRVSWDKNSVEFDEVIKFLSVSDSAT